MGGQHEASAFHRYFHLPVFTGHAWDGYDWESGSHVEIGKRNLVSEGRDIEIYDWGTGEYRGVTVEDMRSTGSGVEVEVYDDESGEYSTLPFRAPGWPMCPTWIADYLREDDLFWPVRSTKDQRDDLNYGVSARSSDAKVTIYADSKLLSPRTI
jgi:hypothetical protein